MVLHTFVCTLCPNLIFFLTYGRPIGTNREEAHTGEKKKKKEIIAPLSSGSSQQLDILYHVLAEDKMMLFEKSQGFSIGKCLQAIPPA